MASRRCLMMLAAAGLEGLAAAVALQSTWALALPLHAASCGFAAGWLQRRLFDLPTVWSFALVFAGALFLPGLGPVAPALVALGARHPASSLESDLVRTRMPGPPAVAESPPRTASRGEARLAGVAALRARNDPNAIAGLRRALEDPDEDVRLLAHSVLESRSRAADRRIHELGRELEAAPPSGRAAVHRRLASQHWEIAWLDLAHGECLAHVLEVARRHALAALDEEPRSAPLHLLLGRIELRRGEPQAATAALLRAAELGTPTTLLRPYLAEAAFLARRFDLVRKRLGGGAGASETVDRIRRYWS